jgi:hypothetical protein
VYSAWGSDKVYSNDFIFHPYGVGWHIDRTCFDGMLAGFLLLAGEPALRLLRVQIGELDLNGIAPGQWCELGLGERARANPLDERTGIA